VAEGDEWAEEAFGADELERHRICICILDMVWTWVLDGRSGAGMAIIEKI